MKLGKGQNSDVVICTVMHGNIESMPMTLISKVANSNTYHNINLSTKLLVSYVIDTGIDHGQKSPGSN